MKGLIMSANPEQHAESSRIAAGLRDQAERLAVADAIRASARRETGVLLRAAERLATAWEGFAVGDEDAAAITGLPPEAFAAARADQPADPGSGEWSRMTDADLAASLLAYGCAHLDAEAELRARFPHIAALADAAALLTAQQEAANPRPPAEWLDGPAAPGVIELMALYRRHVEAIAAGGSMVRVVQPWQLQAGGRGGGVADR